MTLIIAAAGVNADRCREGDRGSGPEQGEAARQHCPQRPRDRLLHRPRDPHHPSAGYCHHRPVGPRHQ